MQNPLSPFAVNLQKYIYIILKNFSISLIAIELFCLDLFLLDNNI